MLAPAQGLHVSHRLVGLLCCASSSLLSDSLQADIPTILTHTNTGCSWPACHHYPACMKEKSGEVVNQTLRLMQNNEETKFSCENNQDPAFTNLRVIYLRWETLSDKNNACEYKGEQNNEHRAQLPLSAHGRSDGGWWWLSHREAIGYLVAEPLPLGSKGKSNTTLTTGQFSYHLKYKCFFGELGLSLITVSAH